MGNSQQDLADGVTLYASADTWIEGEAIRQLKLAATLPGMRRVAGMPDLHPGRGYPVGAAFFSTGCLYPALIGGDIGCGMALWQTALDARRASAVRLVVQLGSIDARLDDSWQSSIADAGLAGHAFAASLGTIGSGNHFAELQKLDHVYDEDAVHALGLERNRLQLLVHSGSRGFGQSILERHMDAHGYNGLDDTHAECAAYLQRHDEALRYAVANRELIARRMLARWRSGGQRILDVNHNLVGRAVVDGVPGWLHRKGATPADAGPVVIPGSRGDYSYLVEPLPRDDAASLASLAHGAGRKWSRGDCRGRLERRFAPWQLTRTRLGSHVVCENRELLYEEAPQAYKPIDSVVDALEAAGLLRTLARLAPVLTYKTSGGVLLMMLQISSAHGPAECQLAAAKALQRLQVEADASGVALTVLDLQPGDRPGTVRSALLDLDGDGAAALADRWAGTLQWICASPYRLRHPRKNWFIGVTRCADAPPLPAGDVSFEAMRARGPGGQHVNKTSSAIRATHLATGMSVRVESERSQHANKRLALQLLHARLQEQADQQAGRARQQRRMQHFALERGNPVRVFHGVAFTPSC